MKPTRWFSAIFFFVSSIALAGCYTHLATSNQGYYAYHPRPVYSDTIRPRSGSSTSNATLAEKPLVVYDTTMHGDTMFIDERQVQPSESTAPEAGTDGATVINNYYGPSSYWDDYWGPTWGVSIGIGWPYYHTWYSPWWPYYDYSWYEPFGYFGAYPPLFDCYSPFYASYYGGYYGHGYYGHGFHDHGFHDGFGGYPYDGFGRNVRPGRIGGEYRAGSMTSPVTQPGSIMAHSNFSNPSPTNLTRAANSSFAETNAADELRAASDRNAPMHVVGPDASAAVTRSASPEARGETPIVINRASAPAAYNGATSTYNGAASNGFANAASRPVVVRQMNGQTITTSTASTQSGRQMIVVRRSAGYSSYGNGSSSRGYNSSSRGASARSYSAPARSYSAPARSSDGGGGGYSSGRSGGGESSGGGERSGGGGGERSGGGGGGGGRR